MTEKTKFDIFRIGPVVAALLFAAFQMGELFIACHKDPSSVVYDNAHMDSDPVAALQERVERIEQKQRDEAHRQWLEESYGTPEALAAAIGRLLEPDADCYPVLNLSDDEGAQAYACRGWRVDRRDESMRELYELAQRKGWKIGVVVEPEPTSKPDAPKR